MEEFFMWLKWAFNDWATYHYTYYWGVWTIVAIAGVHRIYVTELQRKNANRFSKLMDAMKSDDKAVMQQVNRIVNNRKV